MPRARAWLRARLCAVGATDRRRRAARAGEPVRDQQAGPGAGQRCRRSPRTASRPSWRGCSITRGPRQSPTFAASSMARQIALIERGALAPVIKVGNLDAERDLTDVRDTVRAYAMLMDRGAPGTVYNVASGVARPTRAVLDTLLSHARVPGPRRSRPRPPAPQRHPGARRRPHPPAPEPPAGPRASPSSRCWRTCWTTGGVRPRRRPRYRGQTPVTSGRGQTPVGDSGWTCYTWRTYGEYHGNCAAFVRPRQAQAHHAPDRRPRSRPAAPRR